MQFFSDVSTTSLIVTLAIILGTVLLYRKVIRPYRQFKHYEKILKSEYKTYVTPFSLIGLGNHGRYKKDYQKYGDSQYSIKKQLREYQVGLSSFTGSVSIDLIDTELIKEFYQRQSEGYYVKFLENPFLSSMKNLIGNGLIFSEGNEWKMKKKIMSNVFNHEFIKSKVGLIARISQDKIEEVEATATAESGEVKMDVSNLFQRVFGNVVVKSFFGDIELSKLEGVEIFTYVNEIFQGNTKRSTNLFAFLLGSKFYRYNLRAIDRQVQKKGDKFNQFARETIQTQLKRYEQSKDKEKQGKEKFNGLIELLVKQNKVRRQTTKEKDEAKDYYNIQDLIDEFTTFFMAGTDTTSNATSILIYLLAQHPHVQDKLRKQIDQLFKSPLDINEITYDSLKKLTYFDDVFKETLRMYSPTAGLFPRLALKDHYIGKIPVKKGLIITLKIKSNHFKEQFYENPFEFNPDRWSKMDPSKIDPYSYFPFSSGQRVCIGQHLALLESKIAVICLLKRYSKITLEKPNFKKYMRTLYAAEQMTTTFEKHK